MYSVIICILCFKLKIIAKSTFLLEITSSFGKKRLKHEQEYLFSSPEPSGSQDELIVYPYSGVRCRRCRCRRRRRRQQCLNIFSSETALAIKAKFYVELPWEGGTKIYINGPGQMVKIFFSRNRSPMILKLGM